MQPTGPASVRPPDAAAASRPRLSIPRRVFLGFLLVLSASGLVSVVSLVQHQHTTATLRLLQEGYLPLSLTVSEARALQAASDTLLERVMSEHDTTATQRWLKSAEHRRPDVLQQALSNIDRIEQLAPPAVERAAMVRLRRELQRARSEMAQGQKGYDELFTRLRAGDRAGSERVLADLRARERGIERRLREAWELVLARIDATGQAAAAQEQQAIAVLAVLIVVVLAVGVAVTWWSQRVLSPLALLQRRVAAVARGEFVRQLGPTTDDEIGQLAREFERMVSALDARDRSLKDANDRVLQTERLAAIGRMAAHVTHEVRNPLSSIALNVELLEEELVGVSAETRGLLSAIQREVKRLTETTEEYLGVARAPRPAKRREDVAELTRDAVQFVSREMEAAGVTLSLDVAEPLPPVELDDAQFRQVLVNLLKNAREAMPNGGRIDVMLDAHEGGARLRVRDTGVGMDADAQTHLFDLFYTTKQGGTGLGLPLTQQIVLAHGGRIRCESERDKGTTFELWFPAEATHDAPARSPQTDEPSP